MLKYLVSVYTEHKGGKSKIDWVSISNEMNRRYYDCQNKWTTVSKLNLKVGRFKPEEDEIILNKINEKGIRHKGLWVELEKILNRRSDVIRKRWKTVLSSAS